MADAELDIKQWGNNLGPRLPAAAPKAARLTVAQRVRVSVNGRQVIITPLNADSLTLEQHLARFDPARHGGEAMAAPLKDAERWRA